MNFGKKVCLSWMLISLLLGHQCSAVFKKWLPNTNYDNPANWDKGRLPCDSDDVQLDKLKQDKPLAISLRRSHTVKSLILPENGEVIFYDDAELHFSEGVDSHSDTNFCKDSGDIHFVASVQDWYNPYNWQDVTLPSSSEIILHTDNVPCVHDTVIFPQDSSFLIKSNIPIKVAAVNLFGQMQSSKSFKDFYSSESGSLQFDFAKSADVTAMECNNPMGCSCGNLKFAETICSHVKCKEPACTKSFKPEGSCCAVCGTLLQLSLGQDFKMDDYRDLLLNVSQKEYEGVSVATSKTEAGFVQVVLADQENGKKAQIAAEHLKDMLVSEKVFGVVDAEVLEQSDTKVVVGKQTGKRKNSFIIPLAVGLTILFLFLIVALFLIFRRTKRIRSHSFPLVTMEDDLELDVIDNSQDADKEQEKFTGTLGADQDNDQAMLSMDNPLYESATNGKE